MINLPGPDCPRPEISYFFRWRVCPSLVIHPLHPAAKSSCPTAINRPSASARQHAHSPTAYPCVNFWRPLDAGPRTLDTSSVTAASASVANRQRPRPARIAGHRLRHPRALRESGGEKIRRAHARRTLSYATPERAAPFHLVAEHRQPNRRRDGF